MLLKHHNRMQSSWFRTTHLRMPRHLKRLTSASSAASHQKRASCAKHEIQASGRWECMKPYSEALVHYLIVVANPQGLSTANMYHQPALYTLPLKTIPRGWWRIITCLVVQLYPFKGGCSTAHSLTECMCRLQITACRLGTFHKVCIHQPHHSWLNV